MNKIIVILLYSLFISATGQAATYYVRTDGGKTGTCDGTLNIAAAGATGGHCAWKHPFDALPPGGSARISGGDTLIIGNGSYRMGYTAGVYDTGSCHSQWPYDCVNAAIPSGLSGNPTRIVGENWNTGCGSKPELYGVERADSILRTNGNDNIEIQCLNITDHNQCILGHGATGPEAGKIACPTSFPFGDWALRGINASGTDHLTLNNVDIHGLSNDGLYTNAGGSNWTVTNTTIKRNGWSGFDGGNFTGDMIFNNIEVSWNGCGETYPGGEPIGCWGQNAGGYGDGFGMTDSSGNWKITNSKFLHNTSDGLDLLYLLATATVTIDRVHAEGNAGNQLKMAGSTKKIINSVAIGNCGYFDGKSFNYAVDHCRALGHPLALAYSTGSTATILNTSIYSEGDGVFLVTQRNGNCNGKETLYMRNNLIQGDTDYHQPNEKSSYMWNECNNLTVNHDYEKAYNLKNDSMAINSSNNTIDIKGVNSTYSNPFFTIVNNSTDVFNLKLLTNSTAINKGLASGTMVNGVPIPSIDYLGITRTAADMGAYEYVINNNINIPIIKQITGQ